MPGFEPVIDDPSPKNCTTFQVAIIIGWMFATISAVVAYQYHKRVEELSLENQHLKAQLQALEKPVDRQE